MTPQIFFLPPIPLTLLWHQACKSYSPYSAYTLIEQPNTGDKESKKGKAKERKRLDLFFQLNANFKKYFDTNNYSIDENMIPEMKSRTQGSRPRTQKKSKAKDASNSKLYHRTSSRTPPLHDTILYLITASMAPSNSCKKSPFSLGSSYVVLHSVVDIFFYKEPYCELDA